MNVMKKYWDTMYICLLFFTPFECALAAIWYTREKYQGAYPDTGWSLVLLFDVSQAVYIICAVCLALLKKKNTITPEKFVSLTKHFITVILLIQYSFIVFLFPNNYTWGCTFLFLIYILILFDLKFMLFNLFFYSALLVLGHILHTEQYFSGEPVFESVWFRIIIFSSYALTSLMITYIIDKFIRLMQEWEDEKELFAEKQLWYYQNLNLMDKELRKFRHDINNHFLCMQELLKQEKLSDLKLYFQDLSNGYSQSEKLYSSGNVIIDSILNYNITHLCSSYVNPVVYGKLPEIVTVSSMDLCTIFSNMLSNAIKGANLLSEKNDLTIRFQTGNKFFAICVTNRTIPAWKREEMIKKESDRNHGHGFKKIQETTEKYIGKFEQTENTETGIFMMQVYLPL